MTNQSHVTVPSQRKFDGGCVLSTTDRSERALGLLESRTYQLAHHTIMNSLRIARAALRARPAAIRAPLQRRGYAEAVNDKASRRRVHSGITRVTGKSFELTLRPRTDQA